MEILLHFRYLVSMTSNRSSPTSSPLLNYLLGLWLGGSLALWGVATYNFSGIPQLFARNPQLARKAGFDPGDDAAKKTSLLWVHSSELNRVYFEVGGKIQLGLGGLALLTALVRRQRLWTGLVIALAWGLAGVSSFYLIPEITRAGRALDFIPRDPPPPGLAEFGRLHVISLGVDGSRIFLLILASILSLSWPLKNRLGGNSPGSS